MPVRATLRKFYASLPAPLDAPRIADRADGIDFMRAILALWVMFSHLLPWAAVTGGKENLALPIKINNLLFQSNGETHPAVLGFIVLSGYCIHRNGFRHNDTGLRTFIIRRFFRIVPVYLLATLVGVILYALSVSLDPELGRQLTGTNAIASAGLLIKLSGASVFLPSLHQSSFQGNAPMTTVIVEIWLYALYALCAMLFLRRVSALWFWRGLSAFWLAVLLIIQFYPGYVGWWHNGSLVGFALYWWIGAACVDPRTTSLIARHGKKLVIIWLTLTVLFMVSRLTIHNDFFLLAELRKVIFALGFGWITATNDRRQNTVFTSLAPLGRAGYSLYALHAPMLITLLLLGFPWWLAGTCAIAVGLLLHGYFELPLQRYGRRLVLRTPSADSLPP